MLLLTLFDVIARSKNQTFSAHGEKYSCKCYSSNARPLLSKPTIFFNEYFMAACLGNTYHEHRTLTLCAFMPRAWVGFETSSERKSTVRGPIAERGPHPSAIDERRLSWLAQVPIQFEFEIEVKKSHPHFKVGPLRGIVPANGAAEVCHRKHRWNHDQDMLKFGFVYIYTPALFW